MIANQEQCLEPDALADLLSGRLPAERFTDALAHVEACERCSQAAEAAGSKVSAAWFEKVLTEDPRKPFDHEPECQAVVGKLLLHPDSQRGQRDGANLPTESLGPYRLLKWLGSGGMSSVYLAEHQRLKRMTAIKLLPREKLLQAGWLERFNREMTSIASLEHPHVVRAIDAGDEAGWHFLVMEYLDGADLSRVCRRMGEIPLPTACELIRQAALGLGAIHLLGMTHRDIKPSNLFLTRGGTVKLLDLGLVLSGDSPLATDERLTTVGHLMGTVPYMAREQLVDASAVDWRADIYSLGATLFKLLTGRAPFGPATNLAQTIQAISSTACPSLKSLKPDVPSEIAELVDRMLSHDPARRPQSADEVAEALTPFCDAASPQALVRAAMNVSEDQEEYLSSQMQPNPLLVGTETKAEDGGARSRWITWTAAAFLPLAFLAGILITITTDKGTLVIESAEPGISVNVTQGDKVIKSLRVEQSAKSVRLQSGKYIVELAGVESDGLEISDSQVLLTRGDKQIVKVRRQSLEAARSTTNETESTGSSYQGKTFAHWMSLLEREKDVAMIAQAMQAVKLLAETDEQKAAAARKCLLPARQLGGLSMSGRPPSGITDDQSGWFMTELLDSFFAFFPEPGMTAIIEEFEEGNELSAHACTLLLGCFQQGTSNYGTTANYLLDDYLVELVGNDNGRAKVLRLETAMAKRIEGMTARRSALVKPYMLRQRIHLLNALGGNLADQPQVVAWAKGLVAAGDEVIENKESYATMNGGGGMSGPDPRGVNLGRSPLDPWTALMISRTLNGFPGKSVALGLLEPTSSDLEEQVTQALSRLAKEYPQETAAAIFAQLERVQSPSSGGMGFGGGGSLDSLNRDARRKIASELLPTTTIDSITVARALTKARESNDPACIFAKEDVEEQMRLVALRMARETASSTDPRTLQKDSLTLYIFATFGLPKQQVQESCDLLLSKYRPYGPQRFDEVSFPAIGELLRKNNPNWDGRHNLEAMQMLLMKYPANVLTAYSKTLAADGFLESRTQVIAPLLSALNSVTPEENRLDRSRVELTPEELQSRNSMIAFLQTDRAKEAIAKLDEAHQQALEKQHPQLPSADLHALLYYRLAVASYFGRDVGQEKAVADSLRSLIKAEQVPGERGNTLLLGMLLMAAEKFGYENIPFSMFKASFSEVAVSENCGDIQRLVKGLHDSRPDEFCEYFSTYVDQFATSLLRMKERQLKNVDHSAGTLFGGLDAVCDGWYGELVQFLLDHPKTKKQTISAMREITQQLSLDEIQFLEKLLPRE